MTCVRYPHHGPGMTEGYGRGSYSRSSFPSRSLPAPRGGWTDNPSGVRVVLVPSSQNPDRETRPGAGGVASRGQCPVRRPREGWGPGGLWEVAPVSVPVVPYDHLDSGAPSLPTRRVLLPSWCLTSVLPVLFLLLVSPWVRPSPWGLRYLVLSHVDCPDTWWTPDYDPVVPVRPRKGSTGEGPGWCGCFGEGPGLRSVRCLVYTRKEGCPWSGPDLSGVGGGVRWGTSRGVDPGVPLGWETGCCRHCAVGQSERRVVEDRPDVPVVEME